jgi:hypothetical protein
MKKQLLMISLFAVSVANAQFSDDMESYALGPVYAGAWSNWSASAAATTESAIATNYRASSGTQSMYIGSDGGGQDAVLDLGNKTTGVWTVDYKLYIPTDSTGFYGFLEVPGLNVAAATDFAISVYFNVDGLANGTASITDDAGTEIGTFTYTNDAWFDVSHVINVDTDTIIMSVNGAEVYSGAFYGANKLNSIDFWSIDAANTYYIDDVSMTAGAVGINEANTSIELTVYPNPVNDVLNISAKENITNVTIYDMVGKVVKNVDFNALTLTVNTDDLPSGTYAVKITAGNASEMIKILK